MLNCNVYKNIYMQRENKTERLKKKNKGMINRTFEGLRQQIGMQGSNVVTIFYFFEG